ncbi:serine acetyltransferase [Myroides odoratimimus]|nr:serine acetyltransferase [Myroides odoratimimus]
MLFNIVLGIYNLVLSIIFYKTIKVYMCNHFTIGMNTIIRKRTKFPHPIGIVIGEGVILGDNCYIYQNVTLGVKNGAYPKLGNNVIIYPNSIIVGNVNIGDNAIIGANSVVLNDVESNSIVAGNPVKKIK